MLRDISLSFFYGAKIGVIGLNGAGKSTLLRIIADVDEEFLGEIVRSPGYSVGFLPQEPRLDEAKTVIDCVREGATETVALLAEYEAINAAFADPMSDEEMERLLERQGKVQDQLDAADAWDSGQPPRAGDGCTSVPITGNFDQCALWRRAQTSCALSPLDPAT